MSKLPLNLVGETRNLSHYPWLQESREWNPHGSQMVGFRNQECRREEQQIHPHSAHLPGTLSSSRKCWTEQRQTPSSHLVLPPCPHRVSTCEWGFPGFLFFSLTLFLWQRLPLDTSSAPGACWDGGSDFNEKLPLPSRIWQSTAGGSGSQQSASRLLLSLGMGPRKPCRERFPLGRPRRMDVTEGRVKTEQEGSGCGGPETPES